MYQQAHELVFKFRRWSVWPNYLFWHVFIWKNMVAIQRLYEDASRKLILTFVLSTKNKCFRVSIMLHCTCEQINTFSGPQFTHCFILQFTLIYHSIVNLQYSFFGVIYICLKFCSLNNLCILVFFNLTKSFLKPFNHLTNLTIFSDYGT